MNRQVKVTFIRLNDGFITSSDLEMVDRISIKTKKGYVHFSVGDNVADDRHVGWMMRDKDSGKVYFGLSTGNGPTRPEDDWIGWYLIKM